jgi:glycosyltransferase involved in cell wall biosynthesis
MARILFISHNALRTGASIALLNILKGLKSLGTDFDVLLLKGGGLEPEFRKLSVVQLPIYSELDQKGVLRRLKGDPKKKLFNSYHTIYANTVITLPAATEVQSYAPGSKLILHVHELEMSVKKWGNPQQFAELAPGVHRFVAVSQAVRRYLTETVKVPAERIVLINEAIDTSAPPGDREKGLKNLGLAGHDFPFIVGGSGTTDWRKGPEIFILIASLFRKLFGDKFLFLWVGGWDQKLLQQLEFDIKRMGLEKHVKFRSAIDDMSDFYTMADVFLLTSREDPYPLVCLEAASYGKPVVCFEDSGGMPEFVGTENGCIIPYLDVQGAAEKLLQLAKDSEWRNRLGENAKRAVLRHDGKEIAALIATLMSSM